MFVSNPSPFTIDRPMFFYRIGRPLWAKGLKKLWTTPDFYNTFQIGGVRKMTIREICPKGKRIFMNIETKTAANFSEGIQMSFEVIQGFEGWIKPEDARFAARSNRLMVGRFKIPEGSSCMLSAYGDQVVVDMAIFEGFI